MAQENVNMPPQGNEAASAPSNPQDIDAAIDALNGVPSDPPSPGASEPAPAEARPAVLDPAPPEQGAAEPQPAAAPSAPASTTPNDDIWSRVDPEVRAARDQELSRFRGRQAAQDKALRESQARIRELEALASSQQGGQQPEGTQDRQGDGQQAGTNRETILNTLREEYPDVAGPLLDEIADMRMQVAELKKPIGALQEREQVAFAEEQTSILYQAHPDWDTVREDPRLYEWLGSQPRPIQEAVARNGESGIVDGAEVAWVVTNWKRDMGIGASSVPQTQAPDPEAERRARQIAAGRDAAGSGPPATTRIPTDIDAAIDYLNSRDAATA